MDVLIPLKRGTGRFASLLILLVLLNSSVSARQLVSFDDAVQRLFPDGVQVNEEFYLLEEEEVATIQREIGSSFEDRLITLHHVLDEQGIAGYALRLDGFGRFEPFTFLLGVNLHGETVGVVLLEYSSSHGGEIGNSSFLDRFMGRSAGKADEEHPAIDAISGATLSSVSMIEGVDRGLWIVKTLLDRPRR